jgi:hypothetical protein
MDPKFEAYVSAELGDVAVSDGGKYINPKVQIYYKIWQHLQRDIENFRLRNIELEQKIMESSMKASKNIPYCSKRNGT